MKIETSRPPRMIVDLPDNPVLVRLENPYPRYYTQDNMGYWYNVYQDGGKINEVLWRVTNTEVIERIEYEREN